MRSFCHSCLFAEKVQHRPRSVCLMSSIYFRSVTTMSPATIDTTRRCLFPEEVDDSTSFESELDSVGLIISTDPHAFLDHRCSPTGVLDYYHMHEKPPLHSTIEVGEDGAEVTLSLVAPNSAMTPLHKGLWLGQCRHNSLMDVDWTPTPPPCKPKSSDQNFVDGWCGNTSTSCISEDVYEVPSAQDLEEAISSFLGDNSDSVGFRVCSDWQECFLSTSNISQVDSTAIETIRVKMRKRVLNMKDRKTRVHQMRRDLSPFNRSPGRFSPQLVRSRSFSISDHASAIVRQSTEPQRRRSSFNVLQLCSLPENVVSDSPMILRYNTGVDQQDVCYDSDPEDFARLRSPRRMHTRQDNNTAHTYPSNIRPRTSIDEFALCNTVQELLNRTLTLVYHPVSTERSVEPSNPVALDAWVERGQILNELIQPKWMWRPKSKYHSRGPLVQAGTVRSIELLDITRITKVTQVDRKLYPFAKPFRSFLIRNIDAEEYCFEANSSEQCDHIVYSLKLAIARFGSLVITANRKVYEEFFVIEGCVPGEPPELVNMLDESCENDAHNNY